MTPEREKQIRETWKTTNLSVLSTADREYFTLMRKLTPSIFDPPPEDESSPCEELVEAITYTIKRNTFRRTYTVTCEGITVETGYY